MRMNADRHKKNEEIKAFIIKQLDNYKGKLPSIGLGGYSIIYWIEEVGGTIYPLCGDCATKELNQYKEEYDISWRIFEVVHGDIEGTIYCEHCNYELVNR
jgi:hypothetical protein